MSSTEDFREGQRFAQTADRRAPKTIEDLTDDALYLIFKYLSCTELIDNVSLVCRRWHDLSVHNSVWIHRHVKATDLGGRQILNKILTEIRVIHTLDLTRTIVEDCTFQTILQSNIRIRNLKLYDCTIDSKALPSVTMVLLHISKTLDGLSIELQNDLMESSSEFNLSEMSNLRKLTLIGDIYLDGNLEKLNLDCPFLEMLDLSRFNSRTYIYSDPRRYFFISNLINETRGNLKELHLPIYCNEKILNSVKHCNYLTTISLQFEYVAVISHLPLIETLIVYCDSSANPPLTWIRPKTLKVLVLHLRRPTDVSIAFLKNLKPESLTLISDNLCKELEHFYSDSINQLILRCHYLRLRHLNGTYLRKLPNLQYLDVRECFLGKGVPPRILATLKNHFACLTVLSDRFIGYQRTRERRDDVGCVIQETTDCSETE